MTMPTIPTSFAAHAIVAPHAAASVRPPVDALDDFSTLSCQRPPAPYCDQDELKLIQAAEREFDEKKRTAILHELLQKNHDGAPMIFMVEVIDIVGLNKRVQGFRNEIQRLSFHDVSFAN